MEHAEVAIVRRRTRRGIEARERDIVGRRRARRLRKHDRRKRVGIAADAQRPVRTACAEIHEIERLLLRAADRDRRLHGRRIAREARARRTQIEIRERFRACIHGDLVRDSDVIVRFHRNRERTLGRRDPPAERTVVGARRRVVGAAVRMNANRRACERLRFHIAITEPAH